jgi:signal transduction histidine kinase
MGWSIHRLRGLAGRTDPASVAAAQRELDALAEAKDRLTETLTVELLHEPGNEPVVPARATDAPRLVDLVIDVRDQLDAEAAREGVVLALDLPEGLGDAPAPPQLRDIVFNLVDNAIDAAASRVVVHLSRIDGHDVVRVCDDGPGLPAGETSRMFEPFFTTKRDGTGMGLAIADALVGDLGGDLRYERVAGVTNFVVLLPASPATPV